MPWAKRCVNLTNIQWDQATDEVKDAILKGIARGDIWLAKIRVDQYGRRIYANVCLEVFLRSHVAPVCLSTSMSRHVKSKICLVHSCSGMQELVELHAKTGVESTGEYLTQEEDRQVGLGMLGLANLLALEGVTYAEFGEALWQHLYESYDTIVTPAARKIVKALQDGINAAAEYCTCMPTWIVPLLLLLLPLVVLPLHRPSRLYNRPRIGTSHRAHS